MSENVIPVWVCCGGSLWEGSVGEQSRVAFSCGGVRDNCGGSSGIFVLLHFRFYSYWVPLDLLGSGDRSEYLSEWLWEVGWVLDPGGKVRGSPSRGALDRSLLLQVLSLWGTLVAPHLPILLLIPLSVTVSVLSGCKHVRDVVLSLKILISLWNIHLIVN